MKEELKLRKIKTSDLERIMKLFPEKELLKNIGLNKKVSEITRKFELNWIKDSIKNYSLKKPKIYNFGIELDGEYIGTIGINKFDHENKNVVIGYWLGAEYRGKGIMTKALKKFLKEINKKFNPVRIVAYVFTFNPSSAKVLKKCGFEYEGTRRKIKKLNGKFVDDKIYAKLK